MISGSASNSLPIDKRLRVSQKPNDFGRVLRWGIDRLPGAALECSVGQLAKSGVVAFQLGLDFDDVVGREHPRCAHRSAAKEQGLTVTQDLFGRRIAKRFGMQSSLSSSSWVASQYPHHRLLLDADAVLTLAKSIRPTVRGEGKNLGSDRCPLERSRL